MFLKKNKIDENTILSELINSYSLLIDPDRIIEITKARIYDFFPIERIEIFTNSGQSYTCDDMSIDKSSNLVNWLMINSKHMDMNKKYSDYVEDCSEVLSKINTRYVFPLISHNKISAIAFVACDKDLRKKTIDFLENLFQLAALSYEATIKIQRERERYKNESQKEKMAVVGRMASYLAHEIRNPLTSIRSSIQFVSDLVQQDNLKTVTTGLLEEVDRVNSLTNFISDFTKPRKLNITHFNIKSTIDSIYKLNETELKKNNITFINIDEKYSDMEISGDDEAFKQILLNFILNSIDAVKNNESKKITAKIKKIENKYLFEWIDTGAGIPQETLNKIFEPFFTTKSKGSGLGLAITKKLLEDQYYDLHVSSKPGTGTRFYFFLNVAKVGRSW